MKSLLALSLLLTPTLASAEPPRALSDGPRWAPPSEYLTMPKERSIKKLLELKPELSIFLCVEQMAPHSKVTYETLVKICREKEAEQPAPREHLGH